jgi:hypothetical protein
MKTCLSLVNVVVVFLLVAFCVSQQHPTKASKAASSSKDQGENGLGQSAINTALHSEQFALSKNKDSYRLNKPVDLTGGQHDEATVSIDYQIGSIDEKPAFATVIQPLDTVSKSPGDVDKFFRVLPNTLTVSTSNSSQTVLQKCSDGQVCVKTKLVDGKEVCVEWRCK